MVVADREPAGAPHRLDGSSRSSSSSSGPTPVSSSRSASSSRIDAASSCTCCFSTTIVTRSIVAASLQVEGPLAGLADGAGGDAVDGAEIHASYPRRFPPRARVARRRALPTPGCRHPARTGRSSPVSFTSRTRGPPPSIVTTETDAVSTTIRWNASSGCAGEVGEQDAEDVAVRRDDDPPAAVTSGDRAQLGDRPVAAPRRSSRRRPGTGRRRGRRCTSLHAFVRRSLESGRPVHEPACISIRPSRSVIVSRHACGERLDGLARIVRAGSSRSRWGAPAGAARERLGLGTSAVVEPDAGGLSVERAARLGGEPVAHEEERRHGRRSIRRPGRVNSAASAARRPAGGVRGPPRGGSAAPRHRRRSSAGGSLGRGPVDPPPRWTRAPRRRARSPGQVEHHRRPLRLHRRSWSPRRSAVSRRTAP